MYVLLCPAMTLCQQIDHIAGCSVPPVVAKDYAQKGKYIDIAGTKTCLSLPTPPHS